MPLFESTRRPALIVHLSGTTKLSPNADEKQLVCSVEQALRLGADGVSIHTNLGVRSENQMISDLARVSESCQEWGLPLLAMIYPRRDGQSVPVDTAQVAHAIRIAMELGVDLVKVPYTGCRASFARALEDVDIPVMVAGGPRLESDEEILRFVDDILLAGASGVAFGRNIFQSTKPLAIARAVTAMVHRGVGFDEAIALLHDEQKVSGTRVVPFPREEQATGTFPANFGTRHGPVAADS
jgi:class I fructose-bisphosphate aldolase